MMYGIDISEHQTRRGIPDFKKIKASGKDFVIIRVGWGGYEGPIDVDDNFTATVNAAIKAGIHIGLYVYTYNRTPSAAKITANAVCDIADNYKGKIDFPIFYDVEEQRDSCLISQGREGLTDTVIAFLKTVEARGYYAAWYTYTYFISTALDYNKLNAYDLWLADYRGKKPLYYCGIYQYTVLGNEGKKGKDYFSTGQQEGIIGNCDQNKSYKDYPAIIRRAELNGFKKEDDKPLEPNNSIDYKAAYEGIMKDLESIINRYTL